MASLNKLSIIGNVGKDPEMKFTPAGKPVTSFSVAVSNSYQKDGEWKEETQWFNITCWGKLAELVNERLTKGQSVYVEGSVKLEEWEGQNGKRSSLKVTASTVKFLTKREKTEDTKTEDTVKDDGAPF